MFLYWIEIISPEDENEILDILVEEDYETVEERGLSCQPFKRTFKQLNLYLTD